MNLKSISIVKINKKDQPNYKSGTNSDWHRGKKLSTYQGERVAYLERAKASVKKH